MGRLENKKKKGIPPPPLNPSPYPSPFPDLGKISQMQFPIAVHQPLHGSPFTVSSTVPPAGALCSRVAFARFFGGEEGGTDRSTEFFMSDPKAAAALVGPDQEARLKTLTTTDTEPLVDVSPALIQGGEMASQSVVHPLLADTAVVRHFVKSLEPSPDNISLVSELPTEEDREEISQPNNSEVIGDEVTSTVGSDTLAESLKDKQEGNIKEKPSLSMPMAANESSVTPLSQETAEAVDDTSWSHKEIPIPQMTIQQRDHIAVLRLRLEDLSFKFKQNPQKYRSALDLIHDNFILSKFLAHFKYSRNPLDDAEKMFRSHVKYRFEDGIATDIRDEWIGKDGRPSSARARLGQLLFYADWLLSPSIKGGLIGVACPGASDWEGLSNDPYALECMKMTHMVFCEENWVYMTKSWKDSEQNAIVIVDGSRLSLRTLGYVSTILSVVHNGFSYYPETMEKCVMINAGWATEAVWSALLPFLPHKLKDSFACLSSDYLEVLSGIIEGGIDAIPEAIGGKLSFDRNMQFKTVTEAYAIVINEIVEKGIAYPDKKEFMQAALLHSETQLWEQTVRIREYMERQTNHGMADEQLSKQAD